MDTRPVETRLLAAAYERGDVGQGPTNRDANIDANPGHLMKTPSFYT